MICDIACPININVFWIGLTSSPRCMLFFTEAVIMAAMHLYQSITLLRSQGSMQQNYSKANALNLPSAYVEAVLNFVSSNGNLNQPTSRCPELLNCLSTNWRHRVYILACGYIFSSFTLFASFKSPILICTLKLCQTHLFQIMYYQNQIKKINCILGYFYYIQRIIFYYQTRVSKGGFLTMYF